MQQDGKKAQSVEVLPDATPSGPGGTIPRTDTVSFWVPSGGNP